MIAIRDGGERRRSMQVSYGVSTSCVATSPGARAGCARQPGSMGAPGVLYLARRWADVIAATRRRVAR